MIGVSNSFGHTDYTTKAFAVNNGIIPTFWTVSKLLNMACHNGNVSNHKLLARLEKHLSYKLLGKYWVPKNDFKKTLQNIEPNKLIQEVFPIQEASITAALFYRYFMEASYPRLNNMFLPTKLQISKFIKQYMEVLDNNYEFVDQDFADFEEPPEPEGPSPADMAELFFKLVIQMAANMVDPTWKTPWFMPGPITPIGMIAKKYLTSGGDEKSADHKEPVDIYDPVDDCPD